MLGFRAVREQALSGLLGLGYMGFVVQTSGLRGLGFRDFVAEGSQSS